MHISRLFLLHLLAVRVRRSVPSIRRSRVSSIRGGRLRTIPPVEDGFVPSAHVDVEIVRFVHLVYFGLFGVEPALEEFSVVPCEVLVAFFDLTEFELERADLVVENLCNATQRQVRISKKRP